MTFKTMTSLYTYVSEGLDTTIATLNAVKEKRLTADPADLAKLDADLEKFDGYRAELSQLKRELEACELK